MSLPIQNIIPVIHAKWFGSDETCLIDNVSIDSRSLQNNNGTLFFALVGQHHDGHQYISELIATGVQHFVVSRVPEKLSDKANFLLVNNTLEALQQFAAYYRKQFDFPIIGITGSNGKTIVKEWLNFLLSPEYNIIRSPKSYNSQVGVPLSVIGINERHNLGIFEAGISLVGEMEKLSAIIQPTLGILTNIGSAHNEGFASEEEKISEKLKLFKDAEAVILRKNVKVEALLSPSQKTFTWNYNDASADVSISKKGASVLEITQKDHRFSVEIPFHDKASEENTITCLMVLLHFGYDQKTIQERIANLYPVEMRLQVKNGNNNCTIIDDSYSSDYQSLKIALDFLEQHKTHQKKTVILSDIFQSGFPVEELYAKVFRLLTHNKIDTVIGIGESIGTYLKDYPNFKSFATTHDFLSQFNSEHFSNETILIKGARSFQFEEIVVVLEEKTHETVLEINLNAISHNLNYYKSKLKPSTKMMVMVKAFGYGSGSFEIAKLLAHHKVDYLGVAFADEGIALRNAGITMPIIVMNPENTAFSAMVAYNLEPEIYSASVLKKFIVLAQQKNLSDYPIHLKLDTGMHRLGFEGKDLDELIGLLKNNNFVSVKSIFSHLSSSDVPEFRDFTLEQIQKFDSWSSLLIKELNIAPIRHILNTSGIYSFAEHQFDMVRLGIGLYGVGNDPEEMTHLENVGTLKTIILQIKEIAVGESVGYSRKFRATVPTRTATIPIGYADGIPRSWGNEKGYVTINHQKARIVGNICMDMLMIDVTNIDCREGDTVIVFGKSPRVTELADVVGTIAYEILTSISHRVKRVFYKE
ncbi:UDP-N-acetylmuramoylalanyl-D-glutamyl-2,6- diaminopimelate--D-alanyl-D-alanine ligase [Flavobacterium cauense R2A-7]|uniref:Alanine racemase n=1 Tax=Flavobacterium cauense R2A-7 TaxID=1341154 RepID=V6SBN7_9FLAO|nr:bifunctional UDP-N-acetylmuramoyl-tripeptide:D-alanyl-D-alanine ligase/alanine racemase [Flavobacterium cauense]ESU21810.1 UDP-N-acetylmuramoylalanyl-D-glutamyl-2,6- diaminopimelate--D-alanyl-D-alanine ligase [Flavobacterium cauense R2A-7]KGO81042.1 alanine racemase [Flavobacterium cauense R2A-7]TWI12957.1 UDP-N-acetylmuramoyl-tripeptide--D-alanyl-D-alanine ligase [Flavobacterium cauense R2A-7]